MSEDNPIRLLVLMMKAIKKAIPEKKKKLNDQIAAIRSETKYKIQKLENEKSGLENSAKFEMAKIVRGFENSFRFDKETEKLFSSIRTDAAVTLAKGESQFNVILDDDGHWHLDFAWSAGGCESGGYQREVTLEECLQNLTIDLRMLDKFINSSAAEKAKFLE